MFIVFANVPVAIQGGTSIPDSRVYTYIWFIFYSNVEEGKNDGEMEMPGCFESTKEATLLTSLGAFGQSWDVYSDIGLSVQFANGKFTQSHFFRDKTFLFVMIESWNFHHQFDLGFLWNLTKFQLIWRTLYYLYKNVI